MMLQAAFDACDGLQKLAPSLAAPQDAITQLAGLHVLASVAYSICRSQPVLSRQLQKAGLYDAVIELLQTHSQQEEEQSQVSNKDCLDWLEASHVGSPMGHHYYHMEPVPEGSAVSIQPQPNSSAAHMAENQGHVTPPQGHVAPPQGHASPPQGYATPPQDSHRRNLVKSAGSIVTQHLDPMQSAFYQPTTAFQHRAGALTDSQTGHSEHSGAPVPSALDPQCPEAHDLPTSPSPKVNDALCRSLARVSMPRPSGVHQGLNGGQEAPSSGQHRSVSVVQASDGGLPEASNGLQGQSEAGATGHLDLPDQVTCAAVEVLLKLATHAEHLLACR